MAAFAREGSLESVGKTGAPWENTNHSTQWTRKS